MQNFATHQKSYNRLQNNHSFSDSMASDVHQGLCRETKTLPAKYFYDKNGSELFDAITQLPEYYPTRTEIQLLLENKSEIAQLLGKNCFLFELGSGSSVKTRLLLDALRPKRYIPMDISHDHLAETTRALKCDYPWLDVYAAYVDYARPWEYLDFGAGSYNIFFPGSSIGNFEPHSAIRLLKRIKSQILCSGGLLIGVDIKKDTTVLEAAYNDSRGITSRFNLNILKHINTRLKANFDIDRFRHFAYYNSAEGRIEMHLESTCAQTVKINGNTYEFKKGETIHTENSYKYFPDEFLLMAREAGFLPAKTWIDDQALFSVHYLTIS